MFEDRAKISDDCQLFGPALKQRFPIRPTALQVIVRKLTDLAEQETDKKLFLDMTRTVIVVVEHAADRRPAGQRLWPRTSHPRAIGPRSLRRP